MNSSNGWRSITNAQGLPMIDIALLITATLLLITCRWWIQKRLQGLVVLLGGSRSLSIKLYSLLFLPGVILHEISHFIMAALLAVPTGEISIFPASNPSPNSDSQVSLGSVKVAKTDFVRATLIGLAPFISGSIALYALVNIFFADIITAPTLLLGIRLLSERASTLLNWQTWVVIYAVLTVANTMFLSRSDIRSWPVVAVFVAIISGLLLLSGFFDSVAQVIVQFATGLARSLASSFFFATVIDGCVIVVLYLIEKILEKITRKRIVYGS
jgi:hypothetical protein